jgi:predicted RNA-binding protein with PUA-like domain
LRETLPEQSQKFKKMKKRKRTNEDSKSIKKPEVLPQEQKQEEDINYFLIKSEPETRIEKGVDVRFSIDDLQTKGFTSWEGVRNHEAKNNLKRMKVSDICLFYHSNCKTPGIAGLAKVIKEAYPDETQYDPKHPYYDPKVKIDEARWFMVGSCYLN